MLPFLFTDLACQEQSRYIPSLPLSCNNILDLLDFGAPPDGERAYR